MKKKKDEITRGEILFIKTIYFIASIFVGFIIINSRSTVRAIGLSTAAITCLILFLELQIQILLRK